MLQKELPKDYVISTGQTRSVKEMVKYVFNKLELDWEKYVVQDKKYFRAEELDYLRGDSSLAQKELGWKIEYSFEQMMDEMIDYWMRDFKKTLIEGGDESK